MAGNTKLNKADDVLVRKNPDQTLSILKIEDEENFYTLDGIAAELYSMIDGTRTLDQIKKQLMEKHSPPKAKFTKDVDQLVKQLKKAQLIK